MTPDPAVIVSTHFHPHCYAECSNVTDVASVPLSANQTLSRKNESAADEVKVVMENRRMHLTEINNISIHRCKDGLIFMCISYLAQGAKGVQGIRFPEKLHGVVSFAHHR